MSEAFGFSRRHWSRIIERQGDDMVQSIGELATDPTAVALVATLAAQMAGELDDAVLAGGALRDLGKHLRRIDHRLARLWGDGLEDELLAITAYVVDRSRGSGPSSDRTNPFVRFGPQTMARLTSDNPLAPDGTTPASAWSDRRLPSWQQQLRDYHVSFQKEKRRGRRSTIDLAVASRVRELRDQGVSTESIAQQFFPGLPLKAARRRIARYVERANIENPQ